MKSPVLTDPEAAAKDRLEYALALHSPLIYGKQTKIIGRLISHDEHRAAEITGGVVPFDPRDTYFMRLKVYLKTQKILRSLSRK